MAAAEGRLDWAVRLLTASEVLREHVSCIVAPREREAFDKAVERMRSGLGAQAFAREWEAGLRRTVAEAVGLSHEVAQMQSAVEGAPGGRQQGMAPRTRTRHPAGLSDREVEVLRLVATGSTNRDIADSLVISPHTVARHVSSIFAKIGAANRAEAATYAAHHGLV